MSEYDALHEAATPAPWEDVPMETNGYTVRISGADMRIITALRNGYASGDLIPVFCHHYEGIKCLHTRECSVGAKRQPCPFDDHETEVKRVEALVEAMQAELDYEPVHLRRVWASKSRCEAALAAFKEVQR